MRARSAALVLCLVFRAAAESGGRFDLSASTGAAAYLREIGVEPGESSPEQRLLIRRLQTLPDIARKIQSSTPRALTLEEWSRILSGMGLRPKPDMSAAEWAGLLAHAGIEASPAPAASEAEPPAPEARPAAAPGEESRPSEAVAPPREEPPAPPAQKISLDLRGMDVLEALKLVSRQSGINLVAGANVRGSVTILLKDVDAREALRLILESQDLACVEQANALRILTAADYERIYGARFDDKTAVELLTLRHIKAAAAARYLEAVKSRVGKLIVYDFNNSLILIDTPESIARIRDLAASIDQPLESKLFAVNYANAEDLMPKLAPLSTKDIGELSMDKRTNRIYATDFADKIRQMERLVQAFDGRHRSVLIEAKILQVTLSSKFQMGVQWEHVFSKINGELIPGAVKGNFAALPIGSLGLTANLGTLAQNNYTALVQLLETAGKTDLLSAPRITALNNEAAKILVGTKEAYVTTTVLTPGGSGASTTSEQVNFVDVGVKLYVTPDIGEDGYVALKIRPEISSVERTLATAQGNTIPIIRTSESETSVLARDGETILIAGLIEDKFERSDSRIPWLGRIPILGFPFRSRTDSKVKTEIVVLLTPKIVTGEAIAAR